MSIRYLSEDRVTGKRQTKAPHNRSRTGYGNKIPTSWMLQLDGKRWYRVYVIQWSNMGSAYIRTKEGDLYLGAYDPGHARDPGRKRLARKPRRKHAAFRVRKARARRRVGRDKDRQKRLIAQRQAKRTRGECLKCERRAVHGEVLCPHHLSLYELEQSRLDGLNDDMAKAMHSQLEKMEVDSFAHRHRGMPGRGSKASNDPGRRRPVGRHAVFGIRKAHSRRAHRDPGSAGKIRLYVWENGGGLSRQWEVAEPLWTKHMAFFIFGRYGGGYNPFGRLNDKARFEARRAAIRAEQRTGQKVRILYHAPPGDRP
jgi:hypothetical protein